MKKIISFLLCIILALPSFPVSVAANSLESKYIKIELNGAVSEIECKLQDDVVLVSSQILSDLTGFSYSLIDSEFEFFREMPNDKGECGIEIITRVIGEIDSRQEKATLSAMDRSIDVGIYMEDNILYLPLEVMLYFLHADWMISDNTLCIYPMPTTILDFLGLYNSDVFANVTKEDELLINTGRLFSNTKFGTSFYSTIADAFSDFDGKLFILWWPGEGNRGTYEGYETSILKLAQNDNEFINEGIAEAAKDYSFDSSLSDCKSGIDLMQNILSVPQNIDEIVNSAGDAASVLTDLSKSLNSNGKLAKKMQNFADKVEDGTIDTLFLSDPQLNAKTKELEKIGDGLLILQTILDVYDTATRVKNWDSYFLNELQAMADFPDSPRINRNPLSYMRNASQKLIDSYHAPAEAALEKAVQESTQIILSKIFDASPFGKAFSIMSGVGSYCGVFNTEKTKVNDMYATLSDVIYASKIEQIIAYQVYEDNLLYIHKKITDERIANFRAYLELLLRMTLRNKVQLYNLNMDGNADKNWKDSDDAKQLYEKITETYSFLAAVIDTRESDEWIMLGAIPDPHDDDLLSLVYDHENIINDTVSTTDAEEDSYTSENPEEDPSASDDAVYVDWQSLYRDLLLNGSYKEEFRQWSDSDISAPRFDLFDVNKDNIPELFIFKDVTLLSHVLVYTVSDQVLSYAGWLAPAYATVRILQESSYINIDYAHSGSGYSSFYALDRGSLFLIHEEKKDMHNGNTYIVNGLDASMDEYNRVRDQLANEQTVSLSYQNAHDINDDMINQYLYS